jgi:hypothetical protein
MAMEKKIKFYILIKTTAKKFSKKIEHRSNKKGIFSKKSFIMSQLAKNF